ncbi:hypothetical protein H4696_003160 [Amycolatopsis lexingtonensis]|uniref:Short chain dehydrogenase n=1 Tax=Amycolatopsis lexingtonensis TaxID=218822 RepID=A0ABR9HYP7_9PSEU|nr:hypothetical protein [Amycolatopsis lexingtonensis]MBE1496060.1 hypothetical protein [Amycolatopsis lexingtonensis]
MTTASPWSAEVARTALENLGKRAHVIPGAANRAADLMGKYLLPRRWSVRLYASIVGRALTGDTGNAR